MSNPLKWWTTSASIKNSSQGFEPLFSNFSLSLMKYNRGELWFIKQECWFIFYKPFPPRYFDLGSGILTTTDVLTTNKKSISSLFLVAAGLNFMDSSSRQFSHSRHFVFVSLGDDRRDSSCQLPPDSSLGLSTFVTSQRFSQKQFFKLDKCCMCLHVSITRHVSQTLSPSQTGYFLLFAWKLSYLSPRGFILINPRHLLGALHGLPGQANTRETK